MKANELMIGDIVEVNNTSLQIAALGTAKAGFIDAKGEMFYHYYDNIEPIELTREILNKNKISTKTSDKKFMGFVFGLPVAMRYVHELQHALKLCGIDKNIEL